MLWEDAFAGVLGTFFKKSPVTPKRVLEQELQAKPDLLEPAPGHPPLDQGLKIGPHLLLGGLLRRHPGPPNEPLHGLQVRLLRFSRQTGYLHIRNNLLPNRTAHDTLLGIKGLASSRPHVGLRQPHTSEAYSTSPLSAPPRRQPFSPTYRAGIQFFYASTLQRPMPLFELVGHKRRRRLPVVLSLEEIQRLLGLIHQPVARMCLTMIYSCGLRLSEGAHLQVRDIDGKRMLVYVRGKGGKDRYVILPERPLVLLREYWKQQRPRPWLFPHPCKPGQPLNRHYPYKVLKAAWRGSGMMKNINVHTLRHSYATHLLEAGINLRVIQELLGHNSPNTTAVYTHLTPKIMAGLKTALDGLMARL